MAANYTVSTDKTQYATRFEIDSDRDYAVVGIGAEHRF